jgi:hypothetical protein
MTGNIYSFSLSQEILPYLIPLPAIERLQPTKTCLILREMTK